MKRAIDEITSGVINISMAVVLLTCVVALPFGVHAAMLGVEDMVAKKTARDGFIKQCLEHTSLGEEACAAEWYIRVEKGLNP